MITSFLCITGNRSQGKAGRQYSNNWFIHGDSETQSHSITDMCKQCNPNKPFTEVWPIAGSLCVYQQSDCYPSRAGGGNPQEEEDEEEVEEKEMSRDVNGIDRTGACPPSFINKGNLLRACGRRVSVTMSNAGTCPGNTCEKL